MSTVTEASTRLAKAGDDVCRALDVWAESREAEVVNELVKAAQHYCAVLIRETCDCAAGVCSCFPAARRIDPEVP